MLTGYWFMDFVSNWHDRVKVCISDPNPNVTQTLTLTHVVHKKAPRWRKIYMRASNYVQFEGSFKNLLIYLFVCLSTFWIKYVLKGLWNCVQAFEKTCRPVFDLLTSCQIDTTRALVCISDPDLIGLSLLS